MMKVTPYNLIGGNINFFDSDLKSKWTRDFRKGLITRDCAAIKKPVLFIFAVETNLFRVEFIKKIFQNQLRFQKNQISTESL